MAQEQWLDVRSDDNFGPRAELRRIAREAGFEPQVATTINALAAGLTLVALGRGILIAPEPAAAATSPDVAVVPLRDAALVAARSPTPPLEPVERLLRLLHGLGGP